ncbi:MAG: sulfite exporter TauE/SafE family protein [Fluviicola sp.]|jgi:uncharacterized membrane protein YfcA|nr:sulfite exporter TauE/SafE family protein [Fluviicola sp.]
MHIIGFIVTIFIGVILGLVGGGGSILTLPVVHYFFGVSMSQAAVYSLFIVGMSASIGVFKRIKTKDFELKEAIIFVIPSTLVAFTMRLWVMPLIPVQFNLFGMETSKDSMMSLLLIIVMTITAVRMIFKSDSQKEYESSISRTLLYGSFTGVLAGIIGAGGGFIIVPALTKMGLSMRKAIGTSMLIITIQSFGALVGDMLNKQISNEPFNYTLLIYLTILTALGVFVGTYLQRFFTGKILRKVFSYLLIAVSLFILIDRFIIN